MESRVAGTVIRCSDARLKEKSPFGDQRRESMAINASKAASGRANTDTVDQDMRQTAGCETKEKVIKTAGKGRGWARGCHGDRRCKELGTARRSEVRVAKAQSTGPQAPPP